MKTTHTIPIILAAFLLSCTGKTNGQSQQSAEKNLTVEQAATAKKQRLAPPPGYKKINLLRVHLVRSYEIYHLSLLEVTYIIIMVVSNGEIMLVR